MLNKKKDLKSIIGKKAMRKKPYETLNVRIEPKIKAILRAWAVKENLKQNKAIEKLILEKSLEQA